MTSYDEWAARWPEAAADLAAITNTALDQGRTPDGASESRATQEVRLSVAAQGAKSFRNNVGATPAKCKHCGERARPVRYGLANDSPAMNQAIKSADLILAIPRTIRPQDVGSTIAQFGSVEVKPPGWTFTGKGREASQMAWANLINSLGGYGVFSTGAVQL
jgi:hypothetical protein